MSWISKIYKWLRKKPIIRKKHDRLLNNFLHIDEELYILDYLEFTPRGEEENKQRREEVSKLEEMWNEAYLKYQPEKEKRAKARERMQKTKTKKKKAARK